MTINMTQVIMEIYEAFRAGNVPEDKARAAAAAISERINKAEQKPEERISNFKSEMKEDFAKVDRKLLDIDKRFTEMEHKFSDMRGDIRLLMWMNGLIILTVVVPVIKNLLGN